MRFETVNIEGANHIVLTKNKEKKDDNISKEAWAMWLAHQTMLINEYRLNPMDPKAKELILDEMEKFLFGEGSDLPDEFVPPES